jgi:hypothetical protein
VAGDGVHVGALTVIAEIMNFSGHDPVGPVIVVGDEYAVLTEFCTLVSVPGGIGCTVFENVDGTELRIPVTIACRASVAPESAA